MQMSDFYYVWWQGISIEGIKEDKINNCQLIPGTDPEINQGGWLAYVSGQVFHIIYVVTVSITIAAKFKDMKWGVQQSVGLACEVGLRACPKKKFENLTSSDWSGAVLIENYGSAGHLQ